jgi:hypothetical protein
LFLPISTWNAKSEKGSIAGEIFNVALLFCGICIHHTINMYLNEAGSFPKAKLCDIKLILYFTVNQIIEL